MIPGNRNRRPSKRRVSAECPRCGSFDCRSRSYDDETDVESVVCNECGMKFSFTREDCDYDIECNGYHIPFSLYVCSECGAYLYDPVSRSGLCDMYVCKRCGTENVVCREPPKDFDRGLNRIRRSDPQLVSDPKDVELAREYIDYVYANDRNAPVGQEYYEGQAYILDAIRRGDKTVLEDMVEVIGDDFDVRDGRRGLVGRIRSRIGGA
ncbi:MAG: hypothetical protein WCR24_07470 [Candidatus Methanomethylophilaceae archaeon]